LSTEDQANTAMTHRKGTIRIVAVLVKMKTAVNDPDEVLSKQFSGMTVFEWLTTATVSIIPTSVSFN
jgi:hypothetical protein